MCDKEVALAEVAKAIAARALTAGELYSEVVKNCATASSFDVQEAAWRLIERDQAELTADLRLRTKSRAARTACGVRGQLTT